MRRVTDGEIATDLLNWTDSNAASMPLTQDARGRPLCPLCAESGYVEVLYLSVPSKRYSCTRKHLYATPAGG